MGLRGKAPSWGLRPHTPKRLIFDWEGSIKKVLQHFEIITFWDRYLFAAVRSIVNTGHRRGLSAFESILAAFSPLQSLLSLS